MLTPFHRSVLPFVLSLVASSFISGAPPVRAAPRLDQTPHAEVDLISRDRELAADHPSWIGLRFKLEPGWHVYWINPGDSGQAPRLKWNLPPGFRAGEIQWPVPERMPAGPLVSYGYGHEVLLPLQLEPVPGAARVAAGSEASLSAEAKWLVCREICLPGKAQVSLKRLVASGVPAPGPAADYFDEALKRLPQPLPDGWKATAKTAGDSIELKITGAPSNTPMAQFFPLEQGQIDNVAPQSLRREGDGFRLTLKKSDQLTDKLDRLRGLISVAPDRGYRVDAPIEAGRSILGMLALAFVGGLLLNFMPCVFPVLSIKVLSLLRAEPTTAAKTFRKHALYYTLGILVSFWILVAALVVLRAGGRQLGWGFQLQSPSFLGILTLVLFFLGLNLMGVFEITSIFGLRPDAGSNLAAREGGAGSFFTGVLATVVSTPCSAPFMGTAVGFAIAEGTLTSFLIFTALGLGLAAPYAALGLHPAWAHVLPRPGRWMETLRQVLAFPVFGTVIWLLWVFSLQTGANGELLALSGLLLVGVSAWGLGRFTGALGTLIGAVAFCAAVALVWAGAHATAPTSSGGDASPGALAAPGGSATAGEELPSVPYSREKLDALRKSGTPVFLDFTAAWCVSCKVNELVVLRSDTFKRKMKETRTVFMKADWTSYDPAVTEALAALGRSGIPVYALYRPGTEAAAPLLLSEFLTVKEAVAALDTLKDAGTP